VGDERAQAAYHREELAWAAGFWDGEGSCGCYGKNDGRKRVASDIYLRASVNQNRREPLDRFVRAVGVGKIYGPYIPTKNLLSQNPQWSYQVSGKAVDTLFDLLWPWLCDPKREQYLIAREKFDERPEPSPQGLGGTKPCSPGCTCGRHSRYSTEGLTEQQIRRREKMREYQARHRAKKKGPQGPPSHLPEHDKMMQ